MSAERYPEFILNSWVRFFFLLTPFFVLSMFLSLTKEHDLKGKRTIALKVTFAVIVVCLALFLGGNFLFDVLGITLDSFRIGAGALLFLSAVSLVKGEDSKDGLDPEGDIVVVPLAIPVAVGPATTGALLVMSAEVQDASEKWLGFLSLCLAVFCVGLMLFLGTYIEKLVGKKGIVILSKITGLMLAAIAAEIVFTGVKNFLSL